MRRLQGEKMNKQVLTYSELTGFYYISDMTDTDQYLINECESRVGTHINIFEVF